MNTEVTTTITVVGMTAGTPPSLTTRTQAVNTQGIMRHITQRVAVRDDVLFERLCAEVSPGDELQVTLVTDWSAKDCMMSLVNFAKVLDTVPAALPTRELATHVA